MNQHWQHSPAGREGRKVMDKAGKIFIWIYLTIVALIVAGGIGVLSFDNPELVAPLDVVLFILFLIWWFLSPFAVGLVLDKAGGKSLRASLVTATVIGGVLYVLDAFVFLSEFFDYVLFVVVLLYFLPTTLWALRTDRRVAKLRAAKAAIYLVAAASIVVTIVAQNHMADRRAVKLGDACLAYRAKYHHYPEDLKALVPEFIPSVPVPRYSLSGERFDYSVGLDGEGPVLHYDYEDSRSKLQLHHFTDSYDIECRCWRNRTGDPVYSHAGRY
jgi:hypothetical protein